MVKTYFEKNIKYYRNKKHIEQQRMAEDLGIPQSTLSCYENGIRKPNVEMIYKIAKYLGIHEDYITRDLTKEEINPIQQQELIFNEFKDYLTESDWNIINTIAVQRKNEIDKEKKDE